MNTKQTFPSPYLRIQKSLDPVHGRTPWFYLIKGQPSRWFSTKKKATEDLAEFTAPQGAL